MLPAEPFFSKQEVADKHVKEGMEIEVGADPVALEKMEGWRKYCNEERPHEPSAIRRRLHC